MRFWHVLVCALSAARGRAEQFEDRWGANISVNASNTTAVVPRRFIVELKEGANTNSIEDEITSKAGTRIVKILDSDIFNGIIVESSSHNTDSLKAIDKVAKAWHSSIIPLSPVIHGQSFSENASAINYSIHHMTGVDKLHDAGLYGKGAVVAVVDTGADLTHPALGGCFGEGCKIAQGYDFVGDENYWPSLGEVRKPDGIPNDQQGHGTHVTGILAGKSDVYTGVAPEATIHSYKVIGQGGSTTEDVLIEAFLMAYENGADIITASIGSDGGWRDDAWALVASRLVDAGVVVTIAAGNSGEIGAFDMSTGASGDNVVAVASINADIVGARQFIANFELDGKTNSTILGYRISDRVFPAGVAGWPVVPMTLDTTAENDTCQPLPANTPDLSKVIALVRVGGCEDYIKQRYLHAFKNVYALYYMDDSPVIDWSGAGFIDSTWGLISKAAGEAIVNTIKAGGNVTADFSLDQGNHYVGMIDTAGGKPSVFTSWGGTYDLTLKPDIAAPGGKILGPYLGGKYRELSGTSMATPYVAGVAALYVGKHGGRSTHGTGWAQTLRSRLHNFGRAVPWFDGTSKDFGFFAPPIQVGTGLIDAVAVLNHATQLSGEIKFSLNDTRHFSRYHQVGITNTGAGDLDYTFEIQEAAGFESYWTSEAANQGYNIVPRLKDSAEIEPFQISAPSSLPQGKFRVPSGQTKTAKFSFDIPQGLNATRLPVFNGKVLVKASNGEVSSIPFSGLAGSLEHTFGDLWYSSAGFPASVSGLNKTPILEKSAYSFNLSLDSQDFPKLRYVLQYASTELRWDIFEESYTEREWKHPPEVGKNKFVGSVVSYDIYKSTKYPLFDPAVNDPNDSFAYPLRVDRDRIYESWWLGSLADGTKIPPGKYKMRIAALVPFGNPNSSDNWKIWETPTIEVL